MRFRKVVKLFQTHSVSTAGEKGSGKDLLTANVIARRKDGKHYISNVNYECKGKAYIKLNFAKIDPKNNFENFLTGDVKQYIYPYPENTDIYISDCGVYFPCQYNEQLNRKYKNIPVFLALSRQLGNCRVHTNAQYIGRVWDKIREQSERYILCISAKVFCGWVFQRIRIYEKYESCEQKALPFRAKKPLLDRVARMQYILEKQRYTQQYGEIKTGILIYRNKSKYDTRIFKEILENGKEE